MMKFLYNKLLRAFCNHTYNCDTQISVIRCDKCGDERWIKYKRLW